MQFKNLADNFGERRTRARLAATKLRGAGSDYARDHSGPDIEVISTGLAVVANAYHDRVDGYSDLSDAFETTYITLVQLEAGSDTLDRQRSNVISSDEYGDPSSDLSYETSLLVDEHDAIRRAEKVALVRLGVAIESVTFGSDIPYDAAGWNGIVAQAAANTDDDSFEAELRAGWVVIADHSLDGTIDGDGIPEETTEKVIEARTKQQTSEEAGLPASLFPPGYDEDLQRFRDLSFPQPGFGAQFLAEEELIEAEELREKLGLDGDSDVREIQIISDTADLHGADELKGKKLGKVYVEKTTASSSKHPAGSKLSDEAIDLIGKKISEDPSSSVGFFNQLGAGHTAELPSVLEGNSGRIKIFSESLAEASHQDDDPSLAFTGAELIEAANVHDEEDGRDGGADWPPETLFIEGDFETGFLASATQASIERREDQNLPAWTRDFNGDPTNIVLARAGENPETVQQVVQGLETSGSIHLILNPEIPYVNASDGNSPIADFLGVAGQDKDTAEIVLGAAIEADEFSDPAVAAGVDRIMGHQATVMYDEAFLAEHGIDPAENGTLSQEEWLALGFTEADWKKLQEKNLEHAQGLALISGNDRLIQQAIANDLQPDENGDGTAEINNDYTQFGLTSGFLERNYVESVIDFEASVDEGSEEFNQWVSTGRSSVLFVAGLGFPPAGLADIYLGHFGEELGLEKDTDNEKRSWASC